MADSLDAVVAGLAPPASPSSPSSASSPTRPSSAAALGAVFSRWEDLVGPAVARHATPLRLEGGTLVVAVDQPPWATQMRVLAPSILAEVAGRTGEVLDRLEVVVRRAR